MCSTVTVALPDGSVAPGGGLSVSLSISPVANNSYGFGTMLSSPPYTSTASCDILAGAATCTVNSELSGLCAGGSTAGTQFTVNATTTGYTGNVPVTTICGECTIFVTDSVASGNLTAIAGNSWSSIDNICATDSHNPGTGTYKAMLVGTVNGVTRRACSTGNCSGVDENINWVLHPNTNYNNLSDALIFTTNSNAIVADSIVSGRIITGSSVIFAYTGLMSDWKTGATCNNSGNSWSSFSNGDSGDGGYPDPATMTGGSPFNLINFWYGTQGGPNTCANTPDPAGIYCVQQ